MPKPTKCVGFTGEGVLIKNAVDVLLGQTGIPFLLKRACQNRSCVIYPSRSSCQQIACMGFQSPQNTSVSAGLISSGSVPSWV
jgi:hypothetical protein